RDAGPARADAGVQAVRQGLEPVAAADAPGGPHDLLVAGARSGVADVVAHGAGEQERGLLHDAELAPVGGEVELADVVPVHEDAAALELVEAGDELPDRGLAGARVPHQGDGLAGRDHEVERLEDGLLRPVAEVDGPELDAALE